MSDWYEAQKVIIRLERLAAYLSPPNNSRDGCQRCKDADTIDDAIKIIRDMAERQPSDAAKGK